MKYSVVINGICKSYGAVNALNEISFQVLKNEIFGLIGPDGSGKSSLFKIIASLLIPDSGTVLVEGLDTVESYRKIRNIIGYMPGKFSLYQDLTVEENLNFFATIFGTSIQENYDLIGEIYSQLEPFKRRLAGKLSGGMKQKLALCCSLIHEPKLLILDEPTTGVDAVSRVEFWEMLKRLKQKGITIIVSTPYMDEASLCDRIGLIQNGALLKTDTPEAIIDSYPKNLYAITSENYYKLIQDLRNYLESARVEPFGEYLHVSSDGFLDMDELGLHLNKEGHSKISYRKIEPSIEDVFLELMNQ